MYAYRKPAPQPSPSIKILIREDRARRRAFVRNDLINPHTRYYISS